jgi:hypothetical protein
LIHSRINLLSGRKKEEGRGKKDEGRRMKEEGRGMRDEGKGKREEGKGKREEGKKQVLHTPTKETGFSTESLGDNKYFGKNPVSPPPKPRHNFDQS